MAFDSRPSRCIIRLHPYAVKHMDLLHFDVNPYTFNSASLSILSLTCLVYILKLREKSDAIRFLTLGIAGLTAGMVALLLGFIVLWGQSLDTFVDACAVFSMAMVVEFAFRYPRKVNTFYAYILRAITLAAAILSLYVTLRYAFRFLVFADFTQPEATLVWYLNPINFIIALFVCIGRTSSLHREHAHIKKPSLKTLFQAMYRPSGRQARLMRNYAITLAFGLIQGFGSGLANLGVLHRLTGMFLINISLILMTTGIIYSSFELMPVQPGLIFRLVGLSLVSLLGIVSVSGMFTIVSATNWLIGENIQNVHALKEGLAQGAPPQMPSNAAYIYTWETGDTNGQLIAASDVQPIEFNQTPRPLASDQPYSVYEYFLQESIRSYDSDLPVLFRYGTHPLGSYYKYVGYAFIENDRVYEVGYSLADISKPIQTQNLGLMGTVLISSIFIFLIYPFFFRGNLIRPLDRLLAGVRQAEKGNLNVEIGISHNDEVGYLTLAFNKMIGSLKSELDRRKAAESQLRELNQSLEERVANRTHELEALYDVSTAASQAYELQTLLSISLERTMEVLNSSGGVIFLFEDIEAATHEDPAFSSAHMYMVTCQGIPSGWLPQMDDLLSEGDLAEPLLMQHEPLLFSNTQEDQRLPAFLRQSPPASLILVPLQAESRVVGILGLLREPKDRFKLDEVALLTSIGSHIGRAIHTEHLRLQAREATVLEERQRLMRDLHDSVIQSLYGLVTLSEAGQIAVEGQDLERSGHLFTRIGQTARQAIREIRLFIHQLRPPILEQEGLINALDLRLAAVEGRSDIQVTFHATEDIDLPLPVETALYHIAQEALNNSLKHARARAVSIHFFRENAEIVLEVCDNGVGFDPQTAANGGLGLIHMNERARSIDGTLKIFSKPGNGTRIQVRFKESSAT